VRRVAGPGFPESESDARLLERYISCHDDAAFAALVHRYAQLVRAVCWRVLRQDQDTDDAFQATFLLFASRAASIQKSASVGCWLYGVAQRTAMNAKRARCRRARQERSPQRRAEPGPVTEAALREIQLILDQEVTRLPEKYRAPFVLCCLEGRSRAEVARQLGWKEGTVSGRLARAREELQRRLTRRGVALSAALCAVTLSREAKAAVPALLLARTVKTSLAYVGGQNGVVPAPVIALTRGAPTTMKLKMATALVLAATVGMIALGALGRAVLAANQADPKQTQVQEQKAPDRQPATRAAPRSEAADSVRVRGQVLDPDGRPLGNAKVYLGQTSYNNPAYPVRATTGEDGRFEFTFTRSELDRSYSDQPRAEVLAMAKGFGSDWAVIGLDSRDAELTLRLGKDVPINGRIVDQDGRPIAGAKVHVTGANFYPGLNLNEVLQGFRQGQLDKLNRIVTSWSGPLPGQPQVLTTGADGRIRLAGFGSERLVYFTIEGPTIVKTWMQVMTRPGEPVDLGKNERYYGASFDHVARPSRPIRGVIRDKATGKPVPGVEIGTFMGSEKAMADKEGRYELRGLPQIGHYDLRVLPANGQPYFGGTLRFDDTPGLEPVTADIELLSGIPLQGRVTDKATGQPVAGARVDYHPLFPNAEVGKLAPFTGPSSEATTGPDGTFTLVVLAGPGVLGATGPRQEAYMAPLVTVKDLRDFFKNRVAWQQNNEEILKVAAGGASMGFIVQHEYHSLVLLDVEEKSRSLKRDLVLEPARTLKGSIVGPDGKPAVGITAHGLTYRGSQTLKTESFTVQGLNPRRSRQLVFQDKEKRLGACLVLKGDESQPLVIKLQPCGSVTGRIVDPDGQPVAGLDIRIHHASLWTPQPNLHVTTGKDGRFRAEGLVAGAKYRVMEASYPALLRPQEVEVEPGKNEELGDMTPLRKPGQ
jgi:RNA polymerase sigma factor (sigma-70 family)